MGNGYSAAYLPYSTTIQEFKVESTNFDASIGHTTGMTVSVMTKSGSNSLHGALTEQHWQQRWNGTRFFVKQQYYRNIAAAEAAGDTALAQRLRDSPKQPSGHSNNYAGTLGGPVVIPKLVNGRNKLFFFFSFDGFEDKKTTESTFNHTVPSLAHREGNFSDLLAIGPRYQLYDPLSVRADPARPGHFVRTPIAGNIIPRSRIINPANATYSKFFPTPNNPPASANLEPLNNYLGVAEPYNWSYAALANRFDYQPLRKAPLLRPLDLAEIPRRPPGLDLRNRSRSPNQWRQPQQQRRHGQLGLYAQQFHDLRHAGRHQSFPRRQHSDLGRHWASSRATSVCPPTWIR